MRLVERHIIQKNHRFYSEIDRLCFLSKNLYNYANYLVRQSFIFEKTNLSYYDLQKILSTQSDYQAIPAKVSQQILMILDRNWKSFLAANEVYKQKPSKFNARPRLPRYKNKITGRNFVVYTTQAISKRQLKQGIINPSKTGIYLKTLVPTSQIKQVRLVPRLNHYVIEVIYEKCEKQYELEKNRCASIDIGLNNLATLSFNQAGIKPLLINGRPLKSINQYYNKIKSCLQSQLQENRSSKRLQKLCNKREFKINDYLHKASRLIINTLINQKIGTLIIGHNEEWKQKINLGKRNNQNFVSVPYNKLIEMLSYKAKMVGIDVIITEESYTSASSFIDNDLIPVYKKGEKNQVTFSGKRIKRGLYRTANKRLINADVNGSLNIMKKAVPNVFDYGIEGVVVHPVRVTPAK
ncbi:MAG: IS200/IS605 family element transposase accessory protein TnpB [Okeania sp. SIO2G4]|uniref:RNA-guided endonuclease InsQ/TnpB family protein n=1 Tax=unclassified Okeania TaxID=2634635 RepID=UPI0013B63359|nr:MULTISPECIES: transposase [unclassified Okeania]NEP41912.1 IS200/IS605 family element transposase accessory protein TnpB [Okeania sp. SIO2H7]NEP73430.1 IS200/IS605 family element transposase accessory protein TnpB [Okeania sp. SIO2G5]NEP93141.1 IS200/IS605 family element transposase accessory protein TnpB [Okeania sp. SIO2F5]NEQ90618.1 IS200/IS605 family element transposase accessory protein TnpB [Okeania sp. SIO2G4]